VALRLRCAAGGSERILTRPNWLEERSKVSFCPNMALINGY
jgi:hypothetical protein